MSKETAQKRIEQVADQVIEMLEKEGTQWSKPWVKAIGTDGLPVNALTGKCYQGFNVFNLMFKSWEIGYKKPIWGTFNQWKSLGATIVKGQKATPIIYFNIKTRTVESTTSAEAETVTFPLLKSFNVFNVSQVEFQTASDKLIFTDEIRDTSDNNKFFNLNAEKIINDSLAEIKFVKGDKAFYSPAQDMIVLPEQQQFNDESRFYGVALHELIHWTGSKKRLARDFKRFGSSAYAFEELIAELGSAMLCGYCQIDSEPRPDHAQYINSWLRVLKNDKKQVIKACSKSFEAVNYLIELSNKTALDRAA